MVLIEALIKPFKLDDVKEALEEIGVGGITVTEVIQAAESRHRARSFAGRPIDYDLVPKMKVEAAVPRHLAAQAIEAILLHGSSGKNEDGKIVARTIDNAIRIRTGEESDDALST
jgi:nitrogen regulatory protein P-II 1